MVSRSARRIQSLFSLFTSGQRIIRRAPSRSCSNRASHTSGTAISSATALREAGIRAQIHTEKKKFKQKLSYADKLSIPYAALLGEDEIAQGKVTVKDLSTGVQEPLTPAEAVELVRSALAARAGGAPIKEPEA